MSQQFTGPDPEDAGTPIVPRSATIPGMTPHDQARVAELITVFVAGCEFERPFHLVVINARGTVSVMRYGLRRCSEGPNSPVNNRDKGPSPRVATLHCATVKAPDSQEGAREPWH